MSWYTDWFLADASEAEAVAGIASDDEHSFDDWPHLALRSVGDLELMLLRGVLRGRPGETEPVDGDSLVHSDDEDGGTSVSAVLPNFLAELADLPDDQIERIAIAWQRTETMAGWEPATDAAVLREMVAFARDARREGKSVLQLATW